MTCTELIEDGLQLPGNVSGMLSAGCLTPMGGMNRSLWIDTGCVNTCYLAPVDEF